jgi:HECT-domain (ubiquitin-transferase)
VTDEFGREMELLPGGKDIDVTDLNKLDYIFRFVDYRVQKQFEIGTKPFLNGFSTVIDRNLLRMFDEDELARLINGGLGNIEIGDLRKHTVYRAGYASNQSYIKVVKDINK